MKKEIPQFYRRYLQTRQQSLLSQERVGLTWRGLVLGSFLSFFLAVGDPYGNMIIRGSYMALDFSTPGALFLFLVLVGLLNLLFKLAGRGRKHALAFAGFAGLAWGWHYWPFALLDPHSPGLIFSTFLAGCALLNLPLAWRGASLALNRADLILVYAMLLMVSAVCSMGLSEQLLPMITALFYYASPQNQWREKLFPHLPAQGLVNDGGDNRAFYEGVGAGGEIPYGAWAEPLLWWGFFLGCLYLSMMCIAVILRRQWMERERLPYPITQAGLALVRGEEEGMLFNRFFLQKAMWAGLALPLVVGSLQALQRYDPTVPASRLQWQLPLVGAQFVQLSISFAMLGFSYLINSSIATGIWVFHLLSKFEKELLYLTGTRSELKLMYGVSDAPLLAYQGVGGLLVLALGGLWVAREHLGQVGRQALGRGWADLDAGEILSYRKALLGALAGLAGMVGWLWVLGTPLWVALLFVGAAMLIFIGVTRIVAEAGLAAVRSPMTAPDLVVHGLGSGLVGPTGVVNLSLAFIWAADIRVFALATCANALKLVEEMDLRSRRVVFAAMIAALVIGVGGAVWMIFNMAYRHGGVNLNAWFFDGAPKAAYDNALVQLAGRGVDWLGLGFAGGGAAVMGGLLWARQRYPWWPLHPLGFPIGAESMMDYVWFNVFLAWLIKGVVLRYGGAGLYQRSQPFFLGLIAGHVLCNGLWLCIDYFTGKVGNTIFWV
ncbi:MAG: hypothetical protein FJY95_06380 [Candidatus Handelsmanbacteria bacterium]|nr:hypothetical protein [Candidatus Handelsmanbacteria bacterium]